MQSVNTEIDGSTFAYLDDLFFYLFGHFGDDLFDTRGVDTSVLHELMERQACYLAAHGVEGGEGDCFGCIVHNDLHAGSRFERADITSLAADDTALDFVILDMEDGDGVLCSRLGRHTLDSLDDDTLCLFVCLQAGVVHDLVDIGHRGRLGFVFEGLHKLFLRFLGGHAAQLLELLLRLQMEFVHLLLFVVERLLALLDRLQFLVHFVETALDISLTLVELLLALLQALLMLLYAFVLFAHGIVVL